MLPPPGESIGPHVVDLEQPPIAGAVRVEGADAVRCMPRLALRNSDRFTAIPFGSHKANQSLEVTDLWCFH